MVSILLVDEDPVFLTRATQELSNAGHLVIVVGSARGALKLLQTGEQIALVVTEIFMPDVDGFELIRTLKLTYPTLPIIAVSTGPDAMLFTAQMLGAGRVMRKPIGPGEIGEAVATLLGPV